MAHRITDAMLTALYALERALPLPYVRRLVDGAIARQRLGIGR